MCVYVSECVLVYVCVCVYACMYAFIREREGGDWKRTMENRKEVIRVLSIILKSRFDFWTGRRVAAFISHYCNMFGRNEC